MSITSISLRRKWEGCVSRDSGYEYALVYMISDLRVIPFEKWDTVDLDECYEARLFGKNEELHIFREDDEWMYVITRDFGEDGTDTDETAPENVDKPVQESFAQSEKPCREVSGMIMRNFATIDRVYPIRKNCMKEIAGRKEAVVREYIGYDEDGQAYTVRTRLIGLR